MSQLEPPALNDLLTQLTRLESVTTDDVAEYDADNATSSPIPPISLIGSTITQLNKQIPRRSLSGMTSPKLSDPRKLTLGHL